jgi:hypothetical protein
VARRAAFYGTLFACTGISPKKEEYKLSELRTLFEVHLRYACMEQNGVFKAVLRMCIDYDSGLTRYSGSGNLTSRPKMTISWLRPLKALSDADLRIIAQKCSTVSGRQLWYFTDFAVIAEQRKQGSAVLNAMRWMLKDDKPGQYTFEALMELDIVQAYDISLEELRDLVADAGKAFVDKWKGPACNDFRSKREHEGLLPGSIVQFMRNRLAGGPPPPELFHGIAEFHVHSEVKRNCQSHVQIMTSVLELPTRKLQESCLWMVDYRTAAMVGGAIGAVDIAKVLQHILFWMSRVTRWNAVIMLAPIDSGTDIEQVLDTFDVVDDIIIQEGTYTFSRHSMDAKKCISHGPYKLHFRSVGGLLYLMRYPRESDWRPNAAFKIDAEWPTSWVEPIREWATTEWGNCARCSRTIMSIMHHSAPEQWMVALVSLMHMVPSTVDNGRQRIMVFEGNEDI